MDALSVPLPSGTLDLHVEQTLYPPAELLDFAVRRNPKRGFLFVSRVLGKHIPISPGVAARTWRELAAALPPLRQPHFIGLAETATALGEGVFRAWQAHTAQAATFQHTTRYLTNRPVLLRFDEPHSHAPAHLLYDPGERARAARELVLVDDELSTGTTLQNLASAWLALHPHVERVVLVSLTDWCPRREELRAALGVPVDFVSLLRGTFAFTPAPDWQPPTLPPVTGSGEDRSAWLPSQAARFGEDVPLTFAALIPALNLSPADRVLVLGTGEFQYPAYALAAALEPQVASVRWSATTRSPILPGLAIRHALSFTDNVGEGIPNFLYNVDPPRYTRILVTYEGACVPDPELLRQLGPHAQALRLL